MRDYREQLVPVFEGERGREAYLRMLEAKKTQRRYDLKEEQEKALNELRKRGFDV